MQYIYIGVSENRGPQNEWFIMDKSITIHDLGVPLFLETPVCLMCSFFEQVQ